MYVYAELPMRIAAVTLRSRFVRTSSVDGRNFVNVGRSVEPDFEFLPPAPHGVIRISVTDGTRRNQADYRI